MDNVEPVELVGRAQEAAELERLVGRVAEGQGQAVVVRGEPGIGKTRLVGTALAACERRGFEAYVVAASEMEMRRPRSPEPSCTPERTSARSPGPATPSRTSTSSSSTKTRRPTRRSGPRRDRHQGAPFDAGVRSF